MLMNIWCLRCSPILIILSISNVQPEVSFLSDSPGVQSEVSFLPDSPGVQSEVSFLPDSPGVQSEVSFLPDSPGVQSEVSFLPDSPGVQSEVSFLPDSPSVSSSMPVSRSPVKRRLYMNPMTQWYTSGSTGDKEAPAPSKKIINPLFEWYLRVSSHVKEGDHSPHKRRFLNPMTMWLRRMKHLASDDNGIKKEKRIFLNPMKDWFLQRSAKNVASKGPPQGTEWMVMSSDKGIEPGGDRAAKRMFQIPMMQWYLRDLSKADKDSRQFRNKRLFLNPMTLQWYHRGAAAAARQDSRNIALKRKRGKYDLPFGGHGTIWINLNTPQPDKVWTNFG